MKMRSGEPVAVTRPSHHDEIGMMRMIGEGTGLIIGVAPTRRNAGRVRWALDQRHALAPTDLGEKRTRLLTLVVDACFEVSECRCNGSADRPCVVARGVRDFPGRGAEIAHLYVRARELGDPQRRFHHGLIKRVAGRRNEDALDHETLGGSCH